MPEAIPTKNYIEQELFHCFIKNTPAPAPWAPDVAVITYSNIEDSPCPQVDTIIESAATEWNLRLSGLRAPKLVKVNDDGMVRIQFRLGETPQMTPYANNALVGPDNLSVAVFDAPMGMALDSSYGELPTRIYSYDYIYRAAAHLFGHVLGLPHARRPADHPGFNRAAYETLSFQSVGWADWGDAKAMLTDLGLVTLDALDSIMHYDVPAPLSATGTPFLCGGSTIDDQAVAVLRTLYAPNVFDHRTFDRNSWSVDIADREKTDPTYLGWEPHVIMSGISGLDMGTRGNFRLDVRADSNSTHYTARMKTWSDTHLFWGKADYLAIPKSTSDIDSGHINFGNLGGSNSGSKTVHFSREFKNPVVVVSLCTIDSWNGAWVRYKCYATDITKKAATIVVETWDNTPVYGVAVTYLVHEATDPTIRSGRFLGPGSPDLANNPRLTSLKSTVEFIKPFAVAPRAVFIAFCHIDIPCGVNLRVKAERVDLNENGVQCKFSTWETESTFRGLDCVYIAIM